MLSFRMPLLRSRSVFIIGCVAALAMSDCSGGSSVLTPQPRGSSGPTSMPSASPTPTPAPTASAPTSSTMQTSALVSGAPIVIPSVGGFAGTVTYTAAVGTTFPANATVTLQSFIGEPTGGSAPQVLGRTPRGMASRRRLDLSPSAVASLQATYNSSVTLSGSLAVTIPNTNPSNTYTAETIDESTGQLIASIQGTPTGSGSYSFVSVGMTYTVTSGVDYLTVIVANSAVSPAPSATPTASASAVPTTAPPTPAPTPTAPASVTISQFAAGGQLTGLAISAASRPYGLDVTNSSLDLLSMGGSVSRYPVSAPDPAPFEGVFNTTSGFADPTFGPDGNLYFPYAYQNAIGKFTPSSGTYTEFPIPQTSAEPLSIVSGPDGALWYTDEANDGIGRVTTTGSFSFHALPTANASPQQIVVGPDGALWFTESGAGKLGRITTAGAITEYPLSYPGCVGIGLTSGPLNSLWYVGCVGNFIFTIDQVTTGGVQTIYQPPAGFGQADPRFLTVGSDGAIWFTDQNANYVGRLVPMGAGAGTWSKYPYPLQGGNGTGNASAGSIKAAPDGSLWFDSFNTGSFYHVTF